MDADFINRSIEWSTDQFSENLKVYILTGSFDYVYSRGKAEGIVAIWTKKGISV